MNFDSLVLEKIVLYDLTSYNALSRCCKTINSKLKLNKSLKSLVLEHYKNTLQTYIQLQLKRLLIIDDSRKIINLEPDRTRESSYVVRFENDEDGWMAFTFFQCSVTKSALDNIIKLRDKYNNLLYIESKVFGKEYEIDRTSDIILNLLDGDVKQKILGRNMQNIVDQWLVVITVSLVFLLMTSISSQYLNYINQYANGISSNLHFLYILVIHIVCSLILSIFFVMTQNIKSFGRVWY